MKLKALVLAAMVAAASFFSPAPARAVECDQLSVGMGICLPRYGTDFDQWATSDINALTLLNSSAAIVGSTSTYNTLGWIAVNRISGMGTGTANIRISSPTYFDAASYLLHNGTATILGNAFSVGVSSLVVSGGNVGIGNVSPNRLLVVGSSSATVSFGGNILSVGAANANAIVVREPGNLVEANMYTDGTNAVFGSLAANPTIISVNNASRMVFPLTQGAAIGVSTLVVTNGNVGVRVLSPVTTLDVGGSAQFGSGVLKSTFSATPGASTYALALSSGLSLSGGSGVGIVWADGTRSTTAAGAGINIYVATGPTTGVGALQLPQRATHYFDGAYFTAIDSPTNNSTILTLNIASQTSVATRQVLTSGTSYTTPAGVNQIKVRMVGGGGGGAGAVNSGTGATGGNAAGTTFNSITAAGGKGGMVNSTGGGGAGGTGGAGSASFRSPGNPGQGSGIEGNYSGGAGGGSLLGGGGVGVAQTNTGTAGAANSGGGGAGGNNNYVGAGGGGGEYVELIINSPAASYSYSISTGATGGVSTANGGAGGSGVIIVDEFYPTIGPTGPTGPAGSVATASSGQINGQLTVVGSTTLQGIVSASSQPGAKAYTASTAQSIANATATDLTFESQDWDQGGMFTAGLSTMTVPAGGAGIYFINCTASFAANAVGERDIYIHINNSGVNGRVDAQGTPGANAQVASAISIENLAAGDKIGCNVYQNSTVSLNVTKRYLVAQKLW